MTPTKRARRAPRTIHRRTAKPSHHPPARIVINHVTPAVDNGRYPAKATVGEPVAVEADVYVDGHDRLRCVVRYAADGSSAWREVRMEPLLNDRWRAVLHVDRTGAYRYTVQAWVDHFATWRHGLEKKVNANVDVLVELQMGAALVLAAAQRAAGKDAQQLRAAARVLLQHGRRQAAVARALSEPLQQAMDRAADRAQGVTSDREWPIVVERAKARYSTWYELFPRSWSAEPGRHGTLQDVVAHLPYLTELGIDVLYLPPIHPTGTAHRKGRNNNSTCTPDDPGSPWAIGSAQGGHMAVHPALGTVKDLRHLVHQAREFGIEVALDLAFQCSPDHPYVREHPAWFRHRPDNTIQHAENAPKQYEDIYPLNFDTDDWRGLWQELKSVVEFWIAQGVTIFRADNPHTKPFAFWEWLLAEIKRDHPDVLFLAEAFTRPQVMYQLAKLGFSQSYTYFTWRNTKWELTQYMTELTQTDTRDFFRPNLWPNTPDILHAYLQQGGRPAFCARLVLAATLSASYGIYGPAYELCVNTPREPGSEEYWASEKYELKQWDLAAAHSLRSLIARVNKIRREHPALQQNSTLAFHPVDNEQLLCYSKRAPDRDDIIVVVVNLDPSWTQRGHVHVPAQQLGMDPAHGYEVHDLLSDARYHWQGEHNYVELNPHAMPAHIFRVCQRHSSATGLGHVS